jgi:hypothetical protein
MQPCSWNCPKVEGYGAKKEVSFCPRNLRFPHLSTFLFLLMALHNVTFNMTIMTWIWSYWFFSGYKVHSLHVLRELPIKRMNFSSLIITNMEMRFKLCLHNLISKWGIKDPEKRQDNLIFISFEVKKFILKNTPINKTLMPVCYNLTDPKEWGVQFFELDLQQGNLDSWRSYSYFLKVLYFYFWYIDFPNYIRNYKIRLKMQKEL